jgi:branched-chain amino acid transport system substrate-binding protein
MENVMLKWLCRIGGLCALGMSGAFAQDITIGAVLPLSGSSVTQGMDQRRGIEIAVDEINAGGGLLGRKLRVIVEDSGGRAPTALDAAKKLVTVDKVPVVLGEYSSGITIPVAQYLLQENRVHLNIGSSSGRIRALGDGAFSIMGLDNVSSEFAARDVLDQGWKNVALIAPNNAFGQGYAQGFKSAFEKMGGQLTGQVLYTEGQTTYRRELQQLQSSKPDAYVYTAYGKDAAIINREAFELGINKMPWYAIYLTMCTADSPAQYVSGQYGMDTNFIGPNGVVYEATYKKRFGESFKTTFSGYAYDGVMMVAQAIRQTGKADAGSLRKGLYEVGKGYEGVTGSIVLDQDRQRSKQPYLKLKLSDGALVSR